MATKKPDFIAYREAVIRGDTKEVRRLTDQIVEENRPLGAKLARRFRNQWSLEIPFDDLLQASVLGILEAIRRYDCERSKFSSYAGDWIRHYLQTCADSHGIYIRRRCVVKAQVIRDMVSFETRMGRLPTAEEMGISQKDWDKIQAPAAQFDSIHETMYHHDGGGAGGDITLEETLPGVGMSPEVGAQRDDLQRALMLLTDREREAFLLWVGGADDREIALHANLAPKNVPSFLEKARRKLQFAIDPERKMLRGSPPRGKVKRK